jgi:hypothetical protein
MALEIPENNSQHFYGIYIYVTCRTSPCGIHFAKEIKRDDRLFEL